ncbi:MAG: chemotaxis protein CheX [Planctomycetes bacterium]|nr:chemotaxis protein CheX [Planctomycetota bacterium]
MEPTKTTTRTDGRELAAVVSKILGDLAFMVGDGESHGKIPADAIWLQGEISYRGPLAGTLRCFCTRDFAVQLTANLLGLDPDEEDARDGADDAMREFMNVLCGHLITVWHGTEAVFNITLPKVVECREPPNPESWASTCHCRLWVAGEPFFCSFEVRD